MSIEITDEEAEEMASRFLENEEAVEFIGTAEDWEMYVTNTLWFERGQALSEKQWDWLSRAREKLKEDMGFSVTRHIEWGREITVFRDIKGLFMPKEVARTKFQWLLYLLKGS